MRQSLKSPEPKNHRHLLIHRCFHSFGNRFDLSVATTLQQIKMQAKQMQSAKFWNFHFRVQKPTPLQSIGRNIQVVVETESETYLESALP